MEGVGDPEGAVGVEAVAVRADGRRGDQFLHVVGSGKRTEARPVPTRAERPVRRDVERRDSVAERLVDDQRAAVRRDDRAIGESEVLGGHARRPVRIDAYEGCGAERGAAHEVEAEVADVGAALGVDDHVVDVPGRHRGQVGVLDQLAAFEA